MTPEREEQLRKERRANCDHVQEHEWARSVEAEEIQRLRAVLASNYSEMLKIKAEKSEAVKEFNEIIKGLKETMADIAPTIEAGSKVVKEEVYGEPNFETNKMEYCDLHGELVFERPLKANERQISITQKIA